jgi:polynucleotide 5'-kinase involved in rRNA processing
MFDNDEFSWGELAGNVTFGITHEVLGSKFFWPEAMTVFIGPAVNVVVSDDYEVESDNMFGLTAGLDIQTSERTGLGVAAEVYPDDEAITGYVMVRF